MSRIIKTPKAKPITCAYCGCVYEFENGDCIVVYYSEDFCGNCKVQKRTLKCPCCSMENTIKFEKENTDNE